MTDDRARPRPAAPRPQSPAPPPPAEAARPDGYPDLSRPPRTISVSARGNGRRSPLRLHFPSWRDRLSRLTLPYGDDSNRLIYDPGLALELLARTGEIPESKYALIVIQAEYRYALWDLATAALKTSHPPA